MNKNFSLFFALLSFGLVFAQQKTVSGVITDDQGVPLPGATIVILETAAGASSDFDGNYSIQVEEGQTLAFSMLDILPKSSLWVVIRITMSFYN